MHRFPHLCLALTLLVACSDDPAGPDPDPDPSPRASAALVSAPVAPAEAGLEMSSVRTAGPRVFVSMPPGTEPGATDVTIRVDGTDASVTAPMIDGGFDPVAIEAVAGDSLSITVETSSGTEVAFARVPATSKPVVVRTAPRHRRVDVPLNQIVQIVFNEPMDPTTLPAAIRLRAAGVDLAGTVTAVLERGDVLSAQFVPDGPLQAGTTYALEISTAARNRAGTPLNASVLTEFTTGSDVADATLVVTVTTTGSGVDPNGFTVLVDDGAPQPIAGNGTLSIPVSPGSRTVVLTGLSGNCALAGNATRTVSALAGESVGVAFEVTCSANTTGTLVITITTAGPDPDADGYSVIIDGGPGQAIGSNGTIQEALSADMPHTVELTGISGNCSPSQSFWPDVQLTAEAPTTIAIEVECTPDFLPSGTVAFTTQSGSTWSIFTSQADGSGRTLIASGSGQIGRLAWSPDGERFAFSITAAEGTDIFVMNADGSNLVRRTDTGVNESPTWSPDGRHVAFGSLRDDRTQWGVYVMDVDGDWSDVDLIGPSLKFDPLPAWSPDGTTIAFVDQAVLESLDAGTGVYLMRPDGSGVVPLPYASTAFRAVGTPDWSPDGTTLAVTGMWGWDFDTDIMLARIDGSGVLALRQWDGWLATWSPDGATLAFQIADCPGSCVGFVTPLGHESSVRLLDAWGVVWRP